jgi:uncharacterized protein (TIGR03437 family)
MLEEAVLWITQQTQADGQPRQAVQAAIAQNAIGNAATMRPAMTISPGSYFSIYGTNLTTGGSVASDIRSPSSRLAGTRVLLNGNPVPVVYASPGQLNVLAPADTGSSGSATLSVQPAGSAARDAQVTLAPVTPGIFIATTTGTQATLWATGLGAVEQRGDLEWTTASPRVTVNGAEAKVSFSGLAPGWPGLYQVNVELPAAAMPPYTFELSVN